MDQDKKNFIRFIVIWFGELVSSIGSGLTSFGLGVYVFQLTGSATACSIVTLCAFLPTVLLNPVAGVLADRMDRRLLMILGDSLSAIGLIIMLFCFFVGINNVGIICLCVILSSVFASLLDPAYKATITDLLTVEQYSKAGGLVQLASAAKFLIAPAIAGVLMKSSGIQLILVIDILTVVFTCLAVFFVGKTIAKNKQKREKSSFFKEFAEGWSILTENKGVVALVLITSLITFYIGFIETLFTPMLLEFTTSDVLGFCVSLAAIGMLLTSLYTGVKGIKTKFVAALSVALAIAGCFVCIIGASRNIYVIAISGFMFFATLPFANTSIDVLLRSSISTSAQGRVWGLISLISQVGYLVAYSISGPLSDYVFNPMLKPEGILANSVGKIIGTGNQRGIGLLLIICGIMTIIVGLYISRAKKVKEIEYNLLQSVQSVNCK